MFICRGQNLNFRKIITPLREFRIDTKKVFFLVIPYFNFSDVIIHFNSFYKALNAVLYKLVDKY